MGNNIKEINSKYTKSRIFIKRYFWTSILLWTVLLTAFTVSDIYFIYKSEFETVKEIATTHLEKDYLYRRWLSSQGGMYLPVSDKIKPNPYLINVKEKNITTPGGRKLTLVNPAYMTRLVHNFSHDRYRIKGHITSLKPINPLNAPDEWEKKALEEFQNGKTVEKYHLLEKNNQTFFLYIHAMYTESSCIKCHGYQNNKIGSIRGAISVSVPWETYRKKIHDQSATAISINVIIWILGAVSLILGTRIQNGNISKIHQFSLKLTDREEQFSYIFENTHEAIVWVDWNQDRAIKCNSAFEQLFRVSRNDLFQKSASDFLRIKKYDKTVIDSIIAGDNRIEELSVKNGKWPDLIIEISATKIHVDSKNAIQYIIRDITQRKEYEREIENQNRELSSQNEEFEVLNEELVATNNELHESEMNLTKLLDEKNTLIRELYHRTKNTMQIIRGMLVLQGDKFENNKDIQYLVNITDQRIQAISLVHQMLYSTNDLSRISILEYINELTSLIMRGFGPENSEKIKTELNIEDCRLLLDTAIPFGLIINELLTNSLKYAFPDDMSGEIEITLSAVKDNVLNFTYRDNGIGVPENFDFRNQNSLGLDLIFSIGEEQMSGTITMENRNGIYFSFTFPVDLYEERV